MRLRSKYSFAGPAARTRKPPPDSGTGDFAAIAPRPSRRPSKPTEWRSPQADPCSVCRPWRSSCGPRRSARWHPCRSPPRRSRRSRGSLPSGYLCRGIGTCRRRAVRPPRAHRSRLPRELRRGPCFHRPGTRPLPRSGCRASLKSLFQQYVQSQSLSFPS